MPELKDATEALASLKTVFNDFKKTNDERIVKLEKNEGTSELEAKLAKMEVEIQKQDGIVKLVEKLQTQLNRKTVPAGEYTDEQKSQKTALMQYMRKGIEKLTPDEQKFLSVQNDPDGGYRVMPDSNGRMVTRIFETSPMRQVAAAQTIGTDALEGDFDDDEAGAEWSGETQPRNETDTAQTGVWRIQAHELSANPLATLKILEDAEIDMEKWHEGKVIEKFSRSENTAFVLGDGILRPRGFLTYDASAVADVYERGTIGQVETASIGVLTFDDITELFYSLKAGWRQNGTMAMNRKSFSVIRKLKDDEGAYLWEPSLQVGQPASILGAPTIEFNDMPDVAEGSLSVAFGDFNSAYQIVDRLGISVLRDPFSNYPKVSFKTRKRVGGAVIGFDAIKLLVTKSS